jgi:hypothetical protein
MLIETKVLGRKARTSDRWSVPIAPTGGTGGDDGLTLRELITRIVHSEVAAFEERDRARRFLRVLSESEITEGALKGKIDPGGRPATQSVDADTAVAAALQGFEDGLYLVILDDVEQRDLDAQIYPRMDSRVLFLRVTFLAGA